MKELKTIKSFFLKNKQATKIGFDFVYYEIFPQISKDAVF